MPTQVQNNIVLPPIQKFVPPPETPAPDAAPRKGEEFGEALKTARKKADAPEKPQPVKEKKKDPKAESKKDDDSKATGKTSAKPAGKTAQPAKSIKPGKSKTSAHDTAAEVDESEASTEAEEPAATDQAAESATTDETETATPTPQTKTAAAAKDDPDHPDQTDPTAAAATAASAHLVQAVDRAKDQNRREKNPDESADGDESADATVQGVTSATAKAIASPATSKTVDEPQSAAQAESQAIPAAATTPHTKAVSIDLGGDAPVEIKPAAPTKPLASTTDPAATTTDASTQPPLPPESSDAPPADAKVAKLSLDLDPIARAVIESQGHTAQPSGNATAPKTADAPPPPPEVQFAQTNHDKIVTGVQTQLLPHGGTMEIRLDPPELGALKVMVEMRDGVMSATFQTSSEEATQLLSHSLNQLKHVLESQGVSVERLQVQQAPKSDSSSTKDDPNQRQQQGTGDDHAARQEQQRKEMMRRMWRRVSGAGDPIDYLA